MHKLLSRHCFMGLFIAIIFLGNAFGTQDTKEEESLSQYSHYSETTTQKANESFFLIEEGKHEEALDPLKYAAEHRARYSMHRYAFYLMSKENLTRSSTPIQDMQKAAELMLMGYCRHVEEATDFIEALLPTMKSIDKSNSQGNSWNTLWDLMQRISSENRKAWLLGGKIQKREDINNFNHIRDLIAVAAVTKLEDIKQFEDDTIQAFKKEYGEGVKVPGLYPQAAHEHAKSVLKLPVDQSINYDQPGATYKYCNTKHKYVYGLNLLMGGLHHRCGSGLVQTTEKFNEFVHSTPLLMQAGPVYEGLKAEKGEAKKTPPKLKDQQKFFIEPFYQSLTPLFKGRPMWLVELTHEQPWQEGEKRVRNKYHGHWPNMGQTSTQGKAIEGKKRTDLQKFYCDEVKKYIESDGVTNSIYYRLALIGLHGHLVQTNKIKEDLGSEVSSPSLCNSSPEDMATPMEVEAEASLTFDLSAESKDDSMMQRIQYAAHITIMNVNHRNSKFLEDTLLNASQIKKVTYSYQKGTQIFPKSFDTLMCKLKRKGIEIEKHGDAFWEGKEKATLPPKAPLSRKRTADVEAQASAYNIAPQAKKATKPQSKLAQ